MRVELEFPVSVSLGDAVPITLRVRNDDTEPAELALTGRPIAFDIAVRRPDGTKVWERLRGETISMMLQVAILAPGESLEFAHEWDQRDSAGREVAAGVYLVHGSVSAEDRELVSEPRRLVIAS
jgi:hypothetical protein